MPPYQNPNITSPVTVQIWVTSSNKKSDSHSFLYTPINAPGLVALCTTVDTQSEAQGIYRLNLFVCFCVFFHFSLFLLLPTTTTNTNTNNNELEKWTLLRYYCLNRCETISTPSFFLSNVSEVEIVFITKLMLLRSFHHLFGAIIFQKKLKIIIFRKKNIVYSRSLKFFNVFRMCAKSKSKWVNVMWQNYFLVLIKNHKPLYFSFLISFFSTFARIDFDYICSFEYSKLFAGAYTTKIKFIVNHMSL